MNALLQQWRAGEGQKIEVKKRGICLFSTINELPHIRAPLKPIIIRQMIYERRCAVISTTSPHEAIMKITQQKINQFHNCDKQPANLYLKSSICISYIDYIISLAQKLFVGNKTSDNTRDCATDSKRCVIPVLSTRGYAHV